MRENQDIRQLIDTGLSHAEFTQSLKRNVFQAVKGGKTVKRKVSLGLAIAMALMLIAVVAVATVLITNRNRMITTINDVTGELIGSVITRNVEQKELKGLLAAQGLTMRFPTHLPDDFNGKLTPNEITISCFVTGDYSDAPELTREEYGMQVEYRQLTPLMIEEVNSNFGTVTVQYIAPNGKTVTMAMWVMPTWEAIARLSGFVELRDDGNYTFESDTEGETGEMGYMHWRQHFTILKEDAAQVLERPDEDFPVIMYEMASSDYDMEEMISMSESLQN